MNMLFSIINLSYEGRRGMSSSNSNAYRYVLKS